MNGYDWDFGFGFGRRYSARPGSGGYDAQFQGRYGRERGWGVERGPGYGGSQGGYGRGSRGYGNDFRWMQHNSYDRGEYGSAYPTFGGYPGGVEQGMYYGGQRSRRGGFGGPNSSSGQAGSMRYDQQYNRGGWDRGGAGYDTEYAREPFMPEAAYQRHPEYNRPQGGGSGRWPSHGHQLGGDWSDEDVEQAVRANMYQDTHVDADRIDVSVNNGVVTLQGEVDDYLEARYAWDDAWEVEGVRGVINQLTVRTDLPAAEQGSATAQTDTGK
jgi:hypothetical protein